MPIQGANTVHWQPGPPIGYRLVTPTAELESIPVGPSGVTLRSKPLPYEDFAPDGTPISDGGRRELENACPSR